MNCFTSNANDTTYTKYNKSSNKQPNFKVPTPDYDQLIKSSKFTKNELMILFERYSDSINNENGLLSKEDFVTMPEMLFCPISSIIFDKNTKNNENSLLSYPEYIKILNIFSLNSTIQEKAQYLFNLMKGSDDVDYMTKEAFSELIIGITQSNHIAKDILSNAIEQSWNDISIDNKLNQKEFNKYLCQYDLHSILTIQY